MLGLVLAVRRARPALFVSVLAADGGADLASTLLKRAIPRQRPRVETLLPRLGDHSFPSGHAATSFACAVVLAAAEPRLRVPLYALAALVAFSRLEVGLHFPLDVIGGAALGIAWAVVLRALLMPAAGRRRPRRSPRAG